MGDHSLFGSDAMRYGGVPPTRVIAEMRLLAPAANPLLRTLPQQNSFGNLACRDQPPQVDQKLARERHDHCLACAPTPVCRSLPIPFCQPALRLELQEAPRQLDHASTPSGISGSGQTLLAASAFSFLWWGPPAAPTRE